ncbi:prenyltransferase/squalene oxidase repeat-containing protein [Calycomorphotria hydatis]|uniref:Prenyltransferase and squalene oxidase repeat protein n=1 Tax=Calycomorphotria hydatis TaxID=2528027 RepID=A0A517TEG7_9PLAN|nr:prenyltransferase/squalene oxidase repeat-containing protein [Calycomorphotria hydatis]QDT66771.1 hypothetical protein V22_40420 [Calycomorphotria hydatis]
MRSIFILYLMLFPSIAFTQEEVAEELLTYSGNEVDDVIDRGIAYLLKQQREDGAITDKGHDTTMTALSIMALASVGVQPTDDTPESTSMRKALRFVLQDDRIDDKGYFGRKDGSQMYGHGIVTLMLTEMLGMGTSDAEDQLIHDRCQQAIDLILSSQKIDKPIYHRGGWRYKPDSRDSDLSVSIWQLMALRSAKNDGLKVPGSAIDAAVEYLKRSYASPLDRNGLPDNQASGFSYIPNQRNPSYTMTAAGLLAMQVCGEYESPLVKGAADWLIKRPPKWNSHYCSYGTYYYAQGMYQRGGDYAEDASRLVTEMLLNEQGEDGAWTAGNGSERNHGKVYCTALSILSLSVKYHYLPIYQK